MGTRRASFFWRVVSLQISPESVDWHRNLEDRLMLADSHLRSFWLTLFAKRLLPFVSQGTTAGRLLGFPTPFLLAPVILTKGRQHHLAV